MTAATPSRRATRSAADAGIGWANSSPVMSEKISPSPGEVARTTTSTLGVASAKASSAAALALSMMTKVPDTAPTPSAIAAAVSSSRPLAARRLLRV